MNIFAGNLSFSATEADLKNLFKDFGNVASVVIVMGKEKKTPKSRGFGFVEMPDEQEALAAIGALNGKEFMGRVLNVDPSRPKTEAQKISELQEKKQARAKVKAESYPRKEAEQKKAWVNPIYNKHLALKDGRVRRSGQPGAHKGGRRTYSYMKRRALSGIQEEAKPRGRSQDNPMRWPKKKHQEMPWQKGPGEHKPWKKAEEGAQQRSKSSVESKPWRKPAGRSKPWEKPVGESRLWKKHDGGFKPQDKSRGELKPWKKTAVEAKPWSKGSERPQGSRFKGRRKPGGHKK